MKENAGPRAPGSGEKALNLDTSLISEGRKRELAALADLIYSSVDKLGHADVVFICTHNSRRSQLAQVWFHLWVDFFGLEEVHAYSGGTETTAFNVRMVDALRRAGFELERLDESGNPHFRLRTIGGDPAGPEFFSKEYRHPVNPQKDFIAVMVCGQADAECPVIPGAYKRFSLPYEDPKVHDGMADESGTYDRKVLEVGREMYQLCRLLEDKAW